jgi:hypothetical protein
MESSDLRTYRGHTIVARKRGLLRSAWVDVWNRGQLLGTFRNVVRAELHIDARLAQD